MNPAFLARLVLVSIAVGALRIFLVEEGARASAIHYAASAQPSAKWTVTRQTFELWASDVRRGGFRFTGGSGPVWVVELTAPGDDRWQHYSAVVVIDAFTGAQEAGSGSAYN